MYLPEENPFLNASGCWCFSEEQIDELFSSNLSGIVTKTCTLLPKSGNPNPTYFKTNDNIHINSKGLPNLGYEYYKNLYKKFNGSSKYFILSVAYYDKIDDIIELLTDYDKFVIKDELVEINLSCPNLHKEICSYNCVLFEEILSIIDKQEFKNLFFSLKLSPYLDHCLCDNIIDKINKYSKRVRYVVLSNSIPNGVILSNGKSVISNLYGGLSGKLNKHISLSNVIYFREKLDKSIKIIGCGGIENINDVMDYLKNGAELVQLASCFYDEQTNRLDINKLNKMIIEYNEIMSRK